MKAKGWAAYITSPTQEVTSMNGVSVQRQKPLEFANEADAVLIGSGVKTREIAADAELLAKLGLVEQELDETMLWLELLVESGIVEAERMSSLLAEADELIRMTVAAIKTTKSRS